MDNNEIDRLISQQLKRKIAETDKCKAKQRDSLVSNPEGWEKLKKVLDYKEPA